VALGRVGTVTLLQGDGGAFPGLGLEGGVLAQTELDALAEASEEGSFVCGSPAEARSSSVAVDSDWGLTVGAKNVGVVFGHFVETGKEGEGEGKVQGEGRKSPLVMFDVLERG
jgi:hypothetical protein